MAPLVTRDGGGLQHPSWTRTNRTIHVVDPRYRDGRSSVLLNSVRWSQRLDADKSSDRGFAVQDSKATPERVWQALQREPPPSRFFFLGHVIADPDSPSRSAIVLPDDNNQPTRFTALDLLLADSAPSEPDARMPDSTVWPVPPRVALIACESGTDLGHVEPFGLPTAFLELGAELVTATRWTLLTDRSFELMGSSATPLLDLSLKIDELHDSDDPIHGLSEWQRERLQAWRTTGAIGDSPLIWAAVTNFYAPDRTDRGQ